MKNDPEYGVGFVFSLTFWKILFKKKSVLMYETERL